MKLSTPIGTEENESDCQLSKNSSHGTSTAY